LRVENFFAVQVEGGGVFKDAKKKRGDSSAFVVGGDSRCSAEAGRRIKKGKKLKAWGRERGKKKEVDIPVGAPIDPLGQ